MLLYSSFLPSLSRSVSLSRPLGPSRLIVVLLIARAPMTRSRGAIISPPDLCNADRSTDREQPLHSGRPSRSPLYFHVIQMKRAPSRRVCLTPKLAPDSAGACDHRAEKWKSARCAATRRGARTRQRSIGKIDNLDALLAQQLLLQYSPFALR